jgi:ActR/RegA family two-component response regulator
VETIMTIAERILIIDDDNAFLETYQEILSAEGYDVETATTRAQALARLDEPGWGVVLLDQKLLGKYGPDTGLDMILEIGRRAPGTKTILVTAFATEEAVIRAFRDGAYDYLEKGSVFEAILRVKVRNAMEAVREREFASLTSDETERAIRRAWAQVRTTADKNRKGKALEDLLALLLKTIPGFDRLDTRLRNEIEEIDIVVQNNSIDPFWQKESPYVLVECKNWSKHVGTKELRDLWGKMDGRYDRCRLALLVAPGGFADTVPSALLTKKEKSTLVLLLGPGELDQFVSSSDRSTTLKEIHRRAVIGVANPHDDP